MITVIGLIGLAQAGKSTAAVYLSDRHYYHRLRFADTLKNMLYAFGLSTDEVDGNKKMEPSEKLCGKTPRWAMQTLGTEWGRHLIGEEVWVNALIRQLLYLTGDKIGQKVNKFVIDDVRFQNEVNALNMLKYRSDKPFFVKIIRIERDVSKREDNHISENALKDYGPDWAIKNDGTLNDFYDQLDILIKSE